MSKLKFLEFFNENELEKLGLKCGLEIHQQLNTGKLFSNRPCRIEPNELLDKEIKRNLRFSLSETGEKDKAAEMESLKNKTFIYKYNDEVASLVDLDEEPPVGPNLIAFQTAVKVGLFLDLHFFDKSQFMRKLIVDGSIVSGFQRTAMIGMGGLLKTSFGNVSIAGVNIEEDSCRAIERGDDYSIFSLDRQGIPLVEITTGPDIKTPGQAIECAKILGTILRSFKETRRGIGTIRQDLNVSIIGGVRVEIKGAQNLKLVPQIIEAEMKRQAIHLSIIEELKSRGISNKNFSDKKIHDVSSVFLKTESEVLLKNLEIKNSKVLGISLKGFNEVLGHEQHKNYRFASEISDRNKSHFPKIKGLFHSDELPKYGITSDEVEDVRKQMNLDKTDAFILIAYEKEYAKKSLEYIFTIIEELLVGVPEEVRQVDPKGTLTTFLRPMPGAARMYPETDVGEIEVKKEMLDMLTLELPEMYDKKMNRLTKKFSLEQQYVEDFLTMYEEEEIETILSSSSRSAKALYSLIFDVPKDIKKRESIEPISFSYTLLTDLLKLFDSEKMTQNAIRDIFISLYKEKKSECDNLKQYVEEKGLLVEKVSSEDLEKQIKEIIEKNKGAPFGALMGMTMKAVPGVDGKEVSSILKKLM